MTERTHIPTSPACGQWETLLADALDGLLRPEDEVFFTEHMATCPGCAELYEEAKRGREWLDFLSLEPEAPEGLLDRILAQTGPGQEDGFGLIPAQPVAMAGGGVGYAGAQPWQRPGLMGMVRRFAEPRLMMTAAMAFFSIALTLNLMGIRVRDFRMASLRPQVVRSYMQRQIAVASTPIIRYYDHLRFVYEVQTRMRELRQSTESQPGGPGSGEWQRPGHQPGHKDGGSRVQPGPDDLNLEETALELYDRPGYAAGIHSGGLRQNGERGTEWIA